MFIVKIFEGMRRPRMGRMFIENVERYCSTQLCRSAASALPDSKKEKNKKLLCALCFYVFKCICIPCSYSFVAKYKNASTLTVNVKLLFVESKLRIAFALVASVLHGSFVSTLQQRHYKNQL